MSNNSIETYEQETPRSSIQDKKQKKEKLKNSKFFLAVLMLTIGVTFTISYYEWQVFQSDYLHSTKVIQVIERGGAAVSQVRKPATDGDMGQSSGNVETKPLPVETVKEKIKDVSLEHGYQNTKLLEKIAFCESSFDPEAQNPKSTSQGIYQFNEQTWEQGCKETGHDNWTLDDRTDIEKATRMAIHFIAKGEISRWNASKSCWQS